MLHFECVCGCGCGVSVYRLLPLQIMLLVGDEVLDNVEQNEMDNKPATFSATHRDFDFGDEAPPIPAHTIASMELVEQPPPSSSRGSRGGGGTSVAMGGVKEDKQPPPPVDTMSSTYDVVGAITDSVYEQPEPPKCEYNVYIFSLPLFLPF